MLQALGQLGSPLSILLGLIALAAVILIGRFILNVAWKLVMVALVVVSGLWFLGTIGVVG